MAALKKSSIVLTVALLALLSSGTASAQPVLPNPAELGVLSCTATAVPPVVRAEGIAELVGDIVISCINIAPAVPTGVFTNYLTTNISVSLNTNVTNNRVSGTILDTVLVINENNDTTPTSAPTFGGPDPRFQEPMYGVLAANNRAEWNGVQIPVPGAPNDGLGATSPCADFLNSAGGCFPSITTLRVTSMRANASQLGVPTQASFPSTQITAFVSITGPTLLPVTNNVLNVAVPILGLLTNVSGAIAGLQCVDNPGQVVNVVLTEGFATSFKTIGVPTFQPGSTQTESGYFSASNNGGGASQATRFIARFFNIPAGVNISVPRLVASGALVLAIVDSTDSNGAGGTVSFSGGSQSVSLSGGFGVAVYEVISSNPVALESIAFPVTVSWVADTTNDRPAIGSGQVSVSFAPLSTVLTSSAGAPEPRFIDTNPSPRTIVTIARCTTTLLFPFVTNQAQFDTGLVISNTSEDWDLLNTDPQNGVCEIHYIGSTTGGGAAPADDVSTVVEAGEQLVWTLSGGNPAQGLNGAPEFQGYVIAVCEFQYGHGFAFITNGFGGIPTLAQGYLALIIPFDGAFRPAGVWHYDADSNSFVPDGFGERLAQ
jgi:hypothetical protein